MAKAASPSQGQGESVVLDLSTSSETAELQARLRESQARDARNALEKLPSVIAWLQTNAAHFGDDHRRQVRLALGEPERSAPSQARTAAAKKANKSTGGRGTSKHPKYRLPDGTKWNGKGRGGAPKAFKDWALTPEGKKWKRENVSGFDWPISDEWRKANPDKVASSLKSPSKKAVAKKGAKKAPAKKAAKRPAKKAK